jgi:hypothetical protein
MTLKIKTPTTPEAYSINVRRQYWLPHLFPSLITFVCEIALLKNGGAELRKTHQLFLRVAYDPDCCARGVRLERERKRRRVDVDHCSE